MKFKLKTISAALMLLTVSALAIAAVDGLSVKRQVKEGQILKLKIKADLEIQGQAATFTALTDQKCTKLEADGTYTIESTQHDGKAVFGGQDIDIPQTPPVSSVYNADGSLKQIKGDDTIASPAAYRMSNLSVLVDPGKTLNVGDSWSVDIKGDTKTGAEAAKAEYKVLGEEKVGDLDTIKVKFSVKETSGAMPASSEGTTWISKVDGTEVKSEAKWTDAPMPGAPMPITATVTISRVQ